jgi:hypothetical protein
MKYVSLTIRFMNDSGCWILTKHLNILDFLVYSAWGPAGGAIVKSPVLALPYLGHKDI